MPEIKPRICPIDKTGDASVVDVGGIPTEVRKITTEVWVDKDGRPVLGVDGKLITTPQAPKLNERDSLSKLNLKKIKVGNSLAKTGHKGRYSLMKYNDEDEFRSKINSFFDLFDDENPPIEKYNKNGELIGRVEKPYTLESLVEHLGISKNTWNKYKTLTDPNFSDICQMAIDRISNRMASGALVGNYNPHMAKFLMTNHDPINYQDKREVKSIKENRGYTFNMIELKTPEDVEKYRKEQECNKDDSSDIIDVTEFMPNQIKADAGIDCHSEYGEELGEEDNLKI